MRSVFLSGGFKTSQSPLIFSSIKLGELKVNVEIAVFVSCSKDDSSDNNSANQNKICDGVTSNSIIPLKQGDAWTWTTLGFGSIIETVVGKKRLTL